MKDVNLQLQHRMENVSSVFFRAIIAAYDYNLAIPEKDRGVDFHVSPLIGKTARAIGGVVKVQLKSELLEDEHDWNNENLDYVRYNLRSVNYNDLVNSSIYEPIILVLVLLPKDSQEWIEYDTNKLIMNSSALWYKIDENSSITENLYSKTIHIPKNQMVKPDVFDPFKFKP